MVVSIYGGVFIWGLFMRLNIIGGAALALIAMGSPAVAADHTPREAAQIEYFSQLGSVAYLVGACERQLPKTMVDQVLTAMTGGGQGNLTDDQRALAGIWSKNYAEGRLELKTRDWTGEQCLRVINENLEDVAAARKRLEAVQ